MDGTLYHIKRTTSTQHEARRRIEQGSAGLGDAIVADEQTTGRGRFGRTWISPDGGLYATWILSLDPLLSLKAGLAVTRVLRCVGIDAGIKWPNDVLVGHLKIAGVLIETTGMFSLVGIGVNLMSSPLDTATCVNAYVDGINRDEWVRRIGHELKDLECGAFDLDAYRERSLTLGRRVRIEGLRENEGVEGIALSIDDAGGLIIETPEGPRTISSGECLHLRN